MTLRKIPIHQSGIRPSLFLGGDRELVMLTGLLSAILIFAAQDWLALGSGVVIWLLALKGFRMMAKADPLMRAVYLRQRRYQVYYPARSTPFRDNVRGYS